MTEATIETTAHAHDGGKRLAMNRMGLWLFLISDGFMFGGLLVARFFLWGDTRADLSQNLGFLVTAILLASSFFMNRGETAMANGDRKNYILFTTITILLGALFLVGVVFVEWPTAAAHGITPDKDTYGAVFYMMTGMHAFHVLTGLVFLGLVLRNARRGLYSPEKHWGVEASAVYWHFIDLVWIFFYPALYLIGSVAGH